MRALRTVQASPGNALIPLLERLRVVGTEDPFVRALCDGDAEAITRLYDRHHQKIRAFALRLLGDQAAAEDLVQDVFLAVPRAMRRYRGEASIETFLLSIAVNRCRRHMRSTSRRRKAMDRLHLEPVADAPSPEGDRAIHRQELRAALKRALAKLPLNQRLAFVLCAVEERTSQDAAAILDVPEGTVRTRLFHARRKLREHLAREGFR